MGVVVAIADEVEEEGTGDVVEAVVLKDVFETVVVKIGTAEVEETLDVTEATGGSGIEEDEMATVGRLKIKEVEETGNGRQESRS